MNMKRRWFFKLLAGAAACVGIKINAAPVAVLHSRWSMVQWTPEYCWMVCEGEELKAVSPIFPTMQGACQFDGYPNLFEIQDHIRNLARTTTPDPPAKVYYDRPLDDEISEQASPRMTPQELEQNRIQPQWSKDQIKARNEFWDSLKSKDDFQKRLVEAIAKDGTLL